MNELGVFAKYWEPGKVKTRLAKSLGDRPAAQVYRLLLEFLLNRVSQVADLRVLGFWPPQRANELRGIAQTAWQLWPQPAGDLSRRIIAYFDNSFQRGADRVVLIGSDSPLVEPGLIGEAFARLDDSSVVLGPTSDGGYYLVGLREPKPQLFTDIAWSTPEVWQTTVDKAKEDGCRPFVLPEKYDVDDCDDLERLLADLHKRQEPDFLELRTTIIECLQDGIGPSALFS